MAAMTTRTTRGAAAAVGLVVLLAVEPAAAQSGRRVALVVGNSAYAHTSVLVNPANDAADVSAALRRLGFEVDHRTDLDRDATYQALGAFARRSAQAEMALVFYAGHGIEVNRRNYLVPVDAQLYWDTDVYQAVELDAVLQATSGAALRVVILDPCRNNPLVERMRSLDGSRSPGRSGLGDPGVGRGMLVAYAAEAGRLAADGEGHRNSPYTRALLAHLWDRVDIRVMFGRVTDAVLRATKEEQQPYTYGSVPGEFYLNGRPDVVDVRPPLGGGTSVETAYWQSVEALGTMEGYLAYEREFPGGRFASLSRLRRLALGSRPVPTPDPPDAPLADTGPVRRDGEVFRDDCALCPEMVVIPAGEFTMGSPASEAGRVDDEGPQRRVRVERFALGRYEVTLAEYAAFVRSTGRGDGDGTGTDCWTVDGRSDASWRSPGFQQTADHPAVCVSWRAASAYVRWLSLEAGRQYRLPSESEWEYAARGGTTSSRHWGEGASSQCGYANGADASSKRLFLPVAPCNDGRAFTAPVGTFSANRFGLFDMLGLPLPRISPAGLRKCVQGHPNSSRSSNAKVMATSWV